MSDRRILVVPDEGLYLAFRLPRLLRQAQFRVDLLTLPGNPLRHSRYVDHTLEAASPDALFARLVHFLRRDHRWSAVVVVKEELARRLVALGDVAVLQRWQPGALQVSARELILSKFGLAAMQKLWPEFVPPCRVCHSLSDTLDFGQSVGWPIITKPPGESGGERVVKHESSATLENAAAPPQYPLLAQQYIEGQIGVTEMLCSNGRALAWLSSYSTHRASGRFGPSTARLFKPIPELTPIVNKVAQLTRFEGFCGFDWIEQTGTGRHFLIEFHPRAPYGFRFGRFCGVDFSAAVSAWLNGGTEQFSTLTQPQHTSLRAHSFTGDLFRGLRQRDWTALRAWLPGSGARHDVYWDDPPLLFGWIADRIQKRLAGNPS